MKFSGPIRRGKKMKIKKTADLQKIKDLNKEKLDFRLLERESGGDIVDQMVSESGRYDIALCMGTSCQSTGASDVARELVDELVKNDLSDRVTLVRTGCNGFCAVGPIMVMYPGGILYHGMTAEDVPEIVSEHILNGRLVERLMFHHPVSNAVIPRYMDLPFFARQELRVLRNKGIIDADSIEEYIGRDGYFGFARALTEMEQDQIIDLMKESGLRGRGGGGFLTGLKWSFCRRAESDKKYILCNADEGDPGAFMDRSIIESDPHAVIEGMLIGALAIGADEGYIYCRAEYPLALSRLETAIEKCTQYGLLGDRILGTDWDYFIIDKPAIASGVYCWSAKSSSRVVKFTRRDIVISNASTFDIFDYFCCEAIGVEFCQCSLTKQHC